MSAYAYNPEDGNGPMRSAADLLLERDAVFERLVAHARTCRSIRQWASAAGVSEAIVRKMRQGEMPKLETLASLESALSTTEHPARSTDTGVGGHDLAYAEEPLTPEALVGPVDLIRHALEIWRNTSGLDADAFRAALAEAGIARRMSSVQFDQDGLLRFDYFGEDMGKLRTLSLNRPVRHLVNRRMAEAAEARMLKADLSGQPQVSRISFGLPGEGVIRCMVLNLPFADGAGGRQIVNVSARY